MSDIILDKNETKNTNLNTVEQVQTVPFWLHNIPDHRQCTARSKRSGERCRRYACRGKNTCKHHGGRSTGPKEPAVKTGNHALDAIKWRLAEKVKIAADAELRILKYDYAKWVSMRLAGMDYPEFRRCRPAMTAFVNGKLSAGRLAAVIEGKPYHHAGRMSE